MRYLSFTIENYKGLVKETIDLSNSRANIFTMVGTVTGTGASAKTYYNHIDHLGSVAAITDPGTYLNQVSAYYPYGNTRVDQTYGPLNQDRGYIGQIYDEEGSMSYLNARYYKNDRGQFVSQDPVHIGIGVDPRTEQALKDPQLMNSYGYARNNPLVYKDPEGEIPVLVPLAVLAIRAALIGASFGIVEQGASDLITAVTTGETHISSLGKYTESAVIGGATMGVSKYLGPSKGVATFIGATYASNVNHGSGAPLTETTIDTALMLTGGKYTKGLVKVPGRDVSTFSNRFFTGSHNRELIRNTSVEAGVTSAGRAVTAGAGIYIDSSGTMQYTSNGFNNSQSTPQRVKDKDKVR